MATIIQFPNSISFLENLKAVRIASSETVAFKLSSGGSTILEETYSPGPSGVVEVELRDVISDFLSIAYPSSGIFTQTSAIAQMTVNVDDGTDQSFTVLSGGVRGLSTTDESFLRANWLTWQPQTKTVRWNQPEHLTFAHLSAGTVKVKFYPKAGGSETVTLHSASAGQVNTYRTQMSTLFALSSHDVDELYGIVDVWVENGGTQQSYVQRYVCTPETRDEHYFSCVNSLGGVDTFCFTGARILSPSVEHASALRGDSRIDITPEPGRSWTQGTGDLDRAESRWIWDFFNSSRRWAEIDGALEEIVIESSSVRASDAENLNAFDFTFSPVKTGRTMKIDRTAGQLPPMEVPSPDGDLFFLAPRIVDYPDATINGSLLLLTQSPLAQEWRKIGIGPLCDYLSDQIHQTQWGQLAHTHGNKAVIDALSEQDGQLLFNGEPVTPVIPEMPDHYIAGTKAKTAASDDALTRVTAISFTAAASASESVDLEVVTINGQRFLHTSLPFFSDSEITAGGVGSGETPGPATTLGALLNVDSEADDTPTTDKILVREAGSTHWTITDLADISGAVTGVRMNGSLMPISNKVVDLGSVATLGTDGKVPSSQLPSYVDDVLEFATLADFPATGESGKIYIALDTNLTYRWGGSAYVLISQSLALGETESTAYRGDRGKTAYDHSQITSGNPHGTTKSDIGLSNVENTALSTWTGSSHITTVGNITTGQWKGTAIADAYVASSNIWNSAKSDIDALKILFGRMFELDTTSVPGKSLIRAKLDGFYSMGEITAGGAAAGSITPSGIPDAPVDNNAYVRKNGAWASLLGLDGYQFMGVATPSTNPGTPDQKVFYIAAQAGNYSFFGDITVSDSDIAIIKYDTQWSKDSIPVAGAKTVLPTPTYYDGYYILNGALATGSAANAIAVYDLSEILDKIGKISVRETGVNNQYINLWGIFNGISSGQTALYSGPKTNVKQSDLFDIPSSGKYIAVQCTMQHNVDAEYLIYNLPTIENKIDLLEDIIEALQSMLISEIEPDITFEDGYYILNGVLNKGTSGNYAVAVIDISLYAGGKISVSETGISNQYINLWGIFDSLTTGQTALSLGPKTNVKQSDVFDIPSNGKYLLIQCTPDYIASASIEINTIDILRGEINLIKAQLEDIRTDLSTGENAIIALQQGLTSANNAIGTLQEEIIKDITPYITFEDGYYITGGNLGYSSSGDYSIAIIDLSNIVGLEGKISVGETGIINQHIYLWGIFERIASGQTASSLGPKTNIQQSDTFDIPTSGKYLVVQGTRSRQISINVIANYFSIIDKNIEQLQSLTEIILPDNIYAVVGDTIQVFFRGIIKAVNIDIYDIRVSCAKGQQYKRYFEYTPTGSDIGTTPFKISLKNNNGITIAEKQCTLITVAVPDSPSAAKNILCFGDSLTTNGEWPAEACRRLIGSGGTPAGKALSNISFCGSKQKDLAGYFGAGGWTWSSYTHAGQPAYRFMVTGVHQINFRAVYANNGHSFTVQEINVNAEGNGNILCSVDSPADTPTASGQLSLISGGGDASITFTSASADVQNPLWDMQHNKMSFVPYATEYADNQINYVYVLLSWNGARPYQENFNNVITQVKIFADTLHSEYPLAKLKIMGLQLPSLLDAHSYGADGELSDTSYSDIYGLIVYALNLNKAYQDFANSDEISGVSGDAYNTFVDFVNVSSQFDSQYNMPISQKKVNTRNSEMENITGNTVHPANNGYMQIADVIFRDICATLSATGKNEE